jgi:hypothetical protein
VCFLGKPLYGRGRLSQKTIPENLKHKSHKNAKKLSAMAASFEASTRGNASKSTASLVPNPFIVTGITLTIPIRALHTITNTKLKLIFNDRASKNRTNALKIPITIEALKMNVKNFKLKRDQDFDKSISRFSPIF